MLHWCTTTVFQRIRCQIGACLAGESPSAIFSLSFSFICLPTVLWWTVGSTLTSQLLNRHPAVLTKGRCIIVDVVRPHSAVTCWHVSRSRRRKNILCWALLITLEMFASYLMVLQMEVPQELEWLHCAHCSSIWACGLLWLSVLTSTIWMVLSLRSLIAQQHGILAPAMCV